MNKGLLVHEWISRAGGSEKVLDRMAATFPDADIMCLWNDDPGRFRNRTLLESWMASTPLRKHKALALPFMLEAWRNVKSAEYEWALISSHAFAHHLTLREQPADFQKFVYAHTPARYLWSPDFDPRGSHPLARVISPLLQALDRRRAAETAKFAANSEFVRTRILDSWHQEADVIYPPVAVERIQSVNQWNEEIRGDERAAFDALPSAFILGASRLIAYKRLDIVIEAGESVGLPVVIAGSGPERERLQARADAAQIPVTFIDAPSDAMLYALYQAAEVFVFPAIEDFGIMPVEAMACGTPVVVNPIGGARESVCAPVGGAVIESFSAAGLRTAITSASSADRRAVAEHAQAFSNQVFDEAISAWVATGVGTI